MKINIIIIFFITSCACAFVCNDFLNSRILNYVCGGISILSFIVGLSLSLSLENKRTKYLFTLAYILLLVINMALVGFRLLRLLNDVENTVKYQGIPCHQMCCFSQNRNLSFARQNWHSECS